MIFQSAAARNTAEDSPAEGLGLRPTPGNITAENPDCVAWEIAANGLGRAKPVALHITTDGEGDDHVVDVDIADDDDDDDDDDADDGDDCGAAGIVNPHFTRSKALSISNENKVVPVFGLCYHSMGELPDAAQVLSELNAPGSSNCPRGDDMQNTDSKVTENNVHLSAYLEEWRSDLKSVFGEKDDVPSAGSQTITSTAENKMPDQFPILAKNRDSMSCPRENGAPGILLSNGKNGDPMWSSTSRYLATRDHGYCKTEAPRSVWHPDNLCDSALKEIRDYEHPDASASQEEVERLQNIEAICMRLRDHEVPGSAGLIDGPVSFDEIFDVLGIEQEQPQAEPIASTSSGTQAAPNDWKKFDYETKGGQYINDGNRVTKMTATKEDDFIDVETISQDENPVVSAAEEIDSDLDLGLDFDFNLDFNIDSDSDYKFPRNWSHAPPAGSTCLFVLVSADLVIDRQRRLISDSRSAENVGGR
ncbi:hypothetical protein M5D96_013220 [Drosophila gunungcola]|uniref:Uncharacterized protein n=1 Tax=Drosophila gunungcola TaxID=103775 RepID=A0A9P9YBW1_9MUSC|nr:hypothetical protein M5D96_013220 [Drosophila gunungcola]